MLVQRPLRRKPVKQKGSLSKGSGNNQETQKGALNGPKSSDQRRKDHSLAQNQGNKSNGSRFDILNQVVIEDGGVINPQEIIREENQPTLVEENMETIANEDLAVEMNYTVNDIVMENHIFSKTHINLDLPVLDLEKDSCSLDSNKAGMEEVSLDGIDHSVSTIRLDSMATPTIRERRDTRIITGGAKLNSAGTQGKKAFGPRHFPFKENRLLSSPILNSLGIIGKENNIIIHNSVLPLSHEGALHPVDRVGSLVGHEPPPPPDNLGSSCPIGIHNVLGVSDGGSNNDLSAPINQSRWNSI